MEKDVKLVEQVATFKRLPKSDSRWRVAFYYIAKEFWDLEEVFVIIDKTLYEEQEDLLKAGDVQGFFADICKKYIVLM